MSIATLKRKTAAKYNNVSVNVPQFSLNGGYRNQGWVGQTSLSRSLPSTPMRGAVARGHGGCCGTYRVTPIVESAVRSTNDPNVIKPSSINTLGLLSTKYRWIRRPQPFTSVKSDYNHNLNSQGDYVSQIEKCAINNTIKEPTTIKTCATCVNQPDMFKHRIDTLQSFTSPYPYSSTKPITYIQNKRAPLTQCPPVAISQGERISILDAACVKNDIKFRQQSINTNICHIPVGCQTK